MPALSTYLWFLVTATVITVVPGPSVLFIVGRSISLGRRTGLISVVGNNMGLWVLVAVVALGVGALITASHVAFIVLKTAGAAYLIYLGVQTIRHRRAAGAATAGDARRVLAQSVLVGFTNPKSLAFFVAVLPQFVHVGRGPAWVQLEIFGMTFAAIALVTDSAWALAAGSARDWFARNPRRIERLGVLGGVMMIGLGGVLATTEA